MQTSIQELPLKQLMHTRYFYSQEGNLAMVAECDVELDIRLTKWNEGK